VASTFYQLTLDTFGGPGQLMPIERCWKRCHSSVTSRYGEGSLKLAFDTVFWGIAKFSFGEGPIRSASRPPDARASFVSGNLQLLVDLNHCVTQGLVGDSH
jgi:hypothetical protein